MTTENIPDPDDPRPTQQKVARVYLSQYLTGPELANTKDAAELIVDVGMYISSVEGAAAEAIKSLTGNCHNDSEVMNDLSELIERLTAFLVTYKNTIFDNILTLEKQRDSAADEAFDNHDFGDEFVADFNGWDGTSHGDEYTRVVFFVNGKKDTYKKTFVVRFKSNDSAEVDEAYVSGE